MGVEHKCCDMEFYKRILIVVLLLMFAGLMSGLTLGLMSLSLVDLEVLAKSGTPQDRNNAGNFSPCLMEHHHAGKGGELTYHETTIIAGALELAEKTAGDAMTPITETYCIDIHSKLDR
ncbi:hypothetical protein JHK87_037221 [Glycine soja]|nr:hypothetical protein JHK87_037221 [Glycine soja]